MTSGEPEYGFIVPYNYNGTATGTSSVSNTVWTSTASVCTIPYVSWNQYMHIDGSIDIPRREPSCKCEYCGCTNDHIYGTCDYCGAPLSGGDSV